MATRRPARRRPSQSGPQPSQPGFRADFGVPRGLRWSCAIIFLAGVVLVALGAWGLLHGIGRAAVAAGFGTSIVVGALLIVFAALLPWLGDGPVRIGPLAVTLRIRERPPSKRLRRRRSRPRRGQR